MMDRLLSGRFLLTIACAVVFVWASLTGKLPEAAMAAILATVFTAYFNRNDRTSPPKAGGTLAALLLFCLLCTPSFSEEAQIGTVLAKIPALKQGMGYSIQDSRINYMATCDVAKIKGFNLEAGYAGIAKNTGDKIVAVISYDLFDAKKFGVTWPIADLIKFRPGVYAGIGRIGGSNETDFGISASFIDIKF